MQICEIIALHKAKFLKMATELAQKLDDPDFYDFADVEKQFNEMESQYKLSLAARNVQFEAEYLLLGNQS